MNLKALCKKYFYHDRAKVYRASSAGGWKGGEMTLIYEDLPCHLAQYGKELSAHRDDTSQKITEDLRLDYDPQFEILENDVIEVQHGGQTFNLVAGTAFKYLSHVELSVRRRKESRQK